MLPLSPASLHTSTTIRNVFISRGAENIETILFAQGSFFNFVFVLFPNPVSRTFFSSCLQKKVLARITPQNKAGTISSPPPF